MDHLKWYGRGSGTVLETKSCLQACGDRGPVKDAMFSLQLEALMEAKSSDSREEKKLTGREVLMHCQSWPKRRCTTG